MELWCIEEGREWEGVRVRIRASLMWSAQAMIRVVGSVGEVPGMKRRVGLKRSARGESGGRSMKVMRRCEFVS